MKKIIAFVILTMLAILPFSAQAGNFTVQWNANPEPVDGYKVHFSTVPGGPYTVLQEVAGDITSIVTTELAAGNYCFVVTAFKAGIPDSSFSDECCGIVPLSTPTGVSCSLN